MPYKESSKGFQFVYGDQPQIGQYPICSSNKWWKVTAIVSMIASIFCLNYFTFNGMRYEHALYRVFLYMPLVLGTFWFGLKGAICISTTVLILYIPYVVEQWQGLSLEDFHEVLEAVLYVIIAFVLAFLVERERKKHRALVRWNHRSNTEPKAPFRMKPSEGPGKLVQIGA